MITIGVPEAVRELAASARERDVPLYLVGGTVRDALLGRTSADFDICGPLPADGLDVLENADFCLTDTINDLGTARIVRRSPEKDPVQFEYTTFRTDTYGKDGSHAPQAVRFTKSMRQDAERRDFTVNALYADPETGMVLDPLGRGLQDLHDGVVRTTHGDAFAEDALRILRMIRFAAVLGFSIGEETLEAARAAVPGLKQIASERIGSELTGILMADVPFGAEDAVGRALFLMRDLGILACILPELMEGAGFEQTKKYHAYDVLEHSLRTCAAAPADLITRLAALLHDVSKPEAYAADGNLYRHPELGAERARRIMRRFALGAAVEKPAGDLIRNHMFDLDNTAHARAVAKRIVRLGPEQFARLADLREADFRGSGKGHDPASARKWRAQLQKMKDTGAPFSVRDLKISGQDLIQEAGIPAGPEVRETLEKLLLYAAVEAPRNDYKRLIRYARMTRNGSRVHGSGPGSKRKPAERGGRVV